MLFKNDLNYVKICLLIFYEKENGKMNFFKKTLSIMLALVIALSAFSVLSFAQGENELKIGLCSDIHTEVVPETEETFDDGMYSTHNLFSGMYTLSFGILDGCAKQVKQDGGQYLLISGDITNMGTLEQYKEALEKLDYIEKKYDLKILLVPGNHDYYTLAQDGVALFREYFYKFGFDEAYTIDDKTNSYAYNLDSKYCLIAVDTNKPGKTGDGMAEDTYKWIEQQTKLAQEGGREVILMTHHSIMPHFLLGEIITANFVLSNYRSVCTRFANLGIKYAFTGHSHICDIAKFESSLGNEIYDINTPSLISAAPEYRTITISDDGVNVAKSTVKSVDDRALIPGGYSEKAYEQMAVDMQSYGDDFFYASFDKFIKSFTNANELLALMGQENNKAIYEITKNVCSRIEDVLTAPLYGEKDSFEAIAKNYGVSIPASDYETLADVAARIIRVYFGMDGESLSANSVEAQLAVTGVGLLVTYVFSGVPNDLKFGIIDALLGTFGISRDDIDVKFTEIIVKGSDDPEFAFEVIHSIIDPLLEGILSDKAPDDYDVTLPAYGEVNTQMTMGGAFGIIKQITSFIKNLLEYIYNVLATALKW